jgi:hypothetical protein
MDYSLFLVKITLNKEEAAIIFGENIRQDQHKAIRQLFSSQESSDNDNINIDNQNNIDNENNEISTLKIDDMKGSFSSSKGNFHDIKYYKQYLYPSFNQGIGYIISIIDYFQYFNFFKVMEAGIISKFKTGLKKEDNNTISCVDPKTYSERFIKYVYQLTDISQIIEGSTYQEEMEENQENNIKNKEIKNSNDDEKEEEMDLYKDNDNLKEDEVKINIKDPQVNFSLRITVMNRNNYNFLNRKTKISKKRNDSKSNE